MASIFAGAAGRRDVNHDIPLVPYIDFLLCLIAFLLVTAVWTRLSRVPADALAPGGEGPTTSGRVLHVEVQERQFRLSWRDGNTVFATSSVEKEPTLNTDKQLQFAELARRVRQEWQANGVHRDISDTKKDRAVLHTRNSAPYAEVVAALDALRATTRAVTTVGSERKMPVFDVSFATD